MSDLMTRLEEEIGLYGLDCSQSPHDLAPRESLSEALKAVRAEVERLRVDVGECKLVMEQQDRDMNRLRRLLWYVLWNAPGHFVCVTEASRTIHTPGAIEQRADYNSRGTIYTAHCIGGTLNGNV